MCIVKEITVAINRKFCLWRLGAQSESQYNKPREQVVQYVSAHFYTFRVFHNNIHGKVTNRTGERSGAWWWCLHNIYW